MTKSDRIASLEKSARDLKDALSRIYFKLTEAHLFEGDLDKAQEYLQLATPDRLLTDSELSVVGKLKHHIEAASCNIESEVSQAEIAPCVAKINLESLIERLNPGCLPIVTISYDHDNAWGIEAFFCTDEALKLVGITYQPSSDRSPWYYELVEFYSGKTKKRANWDDCMTAIEELFS